LIFREWGALWAGQHLAERPSSSQRSRAIVERNSQAIVIPDPERFAEALYALVESVCAKGEEPLDLGFDVVDDDVEMHSVLRGLRFADALQKQLRSRTIVGVKQ